MKEVLVAPEALERWTRELWLAAGSSAREAELTADHLVQANLTGHDSHGVGMVPRYVRSWLAGELQLNQHVRSLADTGSMLTLDGGRGMGQVVTHEAMALAIERAQANGLCLMALKQAHHLGRVGHWAEQAVAQGLVSIHFTNSVSRPNVAPWGGAEGRFNTNPLTVGIPVPGREPILLDFATSAIAQGKARVAFNKGVAVPPGSLIDAQGEATDDPGVLFPQPGNPAGALLTMAAHKGYALAVVCELLGAALIDGPTSRPETLAVKHGVWNSMLTIVFDPRRIGSTDAFAAEAGKFIAWVQSSALRPGHDAVLMPGDPERSHRRQRAAGLPIDAGTLAELDEAAAAVNRNRGSKLTPLSSLAL